MEEQMQQPIQNQRRPLETRWWYWLIVALIILMVMGFEILAIF